MHPIIGSEAIARGDLTRGELRWRYRRLHPDVYLHEDQERTLSVNTHAAWLWSKRRGIITGRAAAAIAGVRSIDPESPIEMIGPHCRDQPGIVVREERIEDDEVRTCGEMRVATVHRTALDLGRHAPRDLAVQYLDELANRTNLTIAKMGPLLERYRGTNGIARARLALSLVDGESQCQEETRVRLLLHDAGFPKPRCNIVLCDGWQMATIGLGWDRAKVGMSFESGRTFEGSTLIQALRRQAIVQRLGWIEFGFASHQHARSLLYTVRQELMRRGS